MTRVVVIGAGPNGLAAAIRLAGSGCDVLVCEAQDAPGGAVRSEALTLPGFVHDTFSAVYPAGAASPVFARMGLDLEWDHPEVCLAHPLPDGRGAALHRSLTDTATSLNALAPGDGDAWARFATPFLDAYEVVRSTMLSGFPPVRGLARPLRLARFGLVGLQPSTLLARRLFQSDGARAWLHGAALHGDARLDRPGSAVAGVHLALLGHAAGWPSPRGGARALTDALVARLASLGGAIRPGARVERVLTRGSRAAGVRLAGGERLEADIVVADVMPHALLALAGDHFGAAYRAALRRYRHGPSTLKVDWALDGPIPWEQADARRAGTVHVGGGERELLDGGPFILLGQQSLADPTRAPAGKHTAWAYTHGASDAERVEAQVERFAPGFRDRILARHVMDSAELERRDANLVGGDVGGGSYTFRQAVFRPLPRWSPYTTPLRGLYLGSAATYPGGGVHGVCGDAAARAALRDREQHRVRAW